MNRTKAGLRKEHDLASEIFEVSGGSIIPLRAGWSGNQGVPSPDLLIPYKGSLRAVEIKTTSKKRLVVSREDLTDIIEWSTNMTEVPTYSYITIKFSYYEAQTMRIPKPWDLDYSLEYISENSPYESRVTRGGNISFGSPKEYDCDVIGSNASPGDGIALLRDLRSDESANHLSSSLDTVGVYEVISKGRMN